MLKSNQPTTPITGSRGRSSARDTLYNLSTLDNIKIREQIRNTQKARARGDSEAANRIASSNHLARQVGRATLRPLIRQHNAREFSDD